MTRYRINSGEYRNRVVFQKKTGNQNDYGEIEDVWTDFLTCNVAIYPLTGKELFSAETVKSEVSHKINMRYIAGIKPDMQILFNGRVFHIQYVINFQERNIQLQLGCKELF